MAVIDRRRIQAALKKKGFVEEKGSRDHDYYFLSYKGKKIPFIFTKISRGSNFKTYGDSLLGEMSKQLKITNNQLKKLVECSINYKKYIQILKEKKILL